MNNLFFYIFYLDYTIFNRSDICTDDLSKNYNNISSLEELYEYSSKGFLDMSSFSSCINFLNYNNKLYNIDIGI